MSTYLDRIHDACTDMRGVARTLQHLANAAGLMGNAKLEDRLSGLASRIVSASSDVESAVGDELNAYFQESQRAVGQTLSALVSKPSAPNDPSATPPDPT